MKFKTTAIALAVAGTVGAPMAAQAEGDVYASARVGIWNVDSGGKSDLEVRSFSSRFGAKGETDLGNGMTAFGRYEWDVDLNDEANTEDLSVRHRYVGLKGDFGKITVGQTGHTFYNYSVAAWDLPWWHVGYNVIAYPNRTDNAITYTGGTDMFSFGITGYFTNMDEGEDSPDGLEVGVSFGIGDMTVGIAVKTTEGTDADVDGPSSFSASDPLPATLGDLGDILDEVSADTASGSTEAGNIGNGSDEDVLGISLSGVNFGSVSMAFGYQSQDDDDALIVHAGIGNAYVHIETESLDAADRDPMGITLGYTQSLGRNTTMYYEVIDIDADTSNSDDDATHVMAVLKYDIL